MNQKMTHTIETATARAITLGYGGEYVQRMAEDWIGKTDAEIEAGSAEFNQTYQRREKYARAAAMETNPDRKSHLESQAGSCN